MSRPAEWDDDYDADEYDRDECICGMTPVNCTTIDPPERKTNKWCPIHGSKDADIDRERMLDKQWDD